MPRVKAVPRTEIIRLAQREARQLTAQCMGGLRRLRRRVRTLEHDMLLLKAKRERYLSPNSIRILRRRLNISQPELARMLGVSKMSVSLWETGKSRPSVEFKMRIVALRSFGRMDVKRLLAEPK